MNKEKLKKWASQEKVRFFCWGFSAGMGFISVSIIITEIIISCLTSS